MHYQRLDREAHVWLVAPEAVQDGAILEASRSVLSESELIHCNRLFFHEDRHRYLISHALVRNVLSRYSAVAPSEWRFSRGDHGRPEIANSDIPPLRFNLTHTAGLAACVVTLSDPCGIDAEQLSARHDLLGVARRMFSIDEYQQLTELGGREQQEYFFSRWTLREAYVKARGIGISFPTRKLTFCIDATGHVSVEFQPELEERSDHWQFAVLSLTPQHLGAIAIYRQSGPALRVVVRHFDF